MHVLIVGAGPVGCCTALALHRRGYNVTIYESRADPRKNPAEGLRSVNLAISARGMRTLRTISPKMATRVASFLCPMSSRCVHGFGYDVSVPYGVHGESINSISRATLNHLLLEEAVLENIPVNFNHKFTGYDGKQAFFGDLSVSCDLLVGCDGTFSAVRASLQRLGDFDYSHKYINHYYLEIPIPPAFDEATGLQRHAFDPRSLHIWPRHEYMMIALPNKDQSMTGTFFAPRELYYSLETSTQFVEFFEDQFPDAYEAVGRVQLEKYWTEHPRGKLLSTTVRPFHWRDRAVLLGDAAHSMVPFYGQGLNSGMEDVRCLLECLEHSERARFDSRDQRPVEPQVAGRRNGTIGRGGASGSEFLGARRRAGVYESWTSHENDTAPVAVHAAAANPNTLTQGVEDRAMNGHNQAAQDAGATAATAAPSVEVRGELSDPVSSFWAPQAARSARPLTSLGAALQRFSETRAPDIAAIQELSMDNYEEMRSSVTTFTFKLRKAIDSFLATWLGERWLPLYTMISFRADIPYSQAVQTAKRQREVLNGLVVGVMGVLGCAFWWLVRSAALAV